MVSVNSSYNSIRPAYINTKHAAKISFNGNPDYIKKDGTDIDNHVSKLGEYCLGLQKCFYKSLKTAGKAFTETAYWGAGSTDNFGTYVAMCATIGLVFGIGSFIIEFPKNLYEAHVNFFTKKEKVNADLANLRTEKTLFEAIGEKSKTADKEEKEKLANDLIKMKMAKPEIIDCKNYLPLKE